MIFIKLFLRLKVVVFFWSTVWPHRFLNGYKNSLGTFQTRRLTFLAALFHKITMLTALVAFLSLTGTWPVLSVCLFLAELVVCKVLPELSSLDKAENFHWISSEVLCDVRWCLMSGGSLGRWSDLFALISPTLQLFQDFGETFLRRCRTKRTSLMFRFTITMFLLGLYWLLKFRS